MNRPVALLATLAFLFQAIPASAAESLRVQQVALELGGEGVIASLHYERLLWATAHQRLLARGGLGYFPMSVNGANTGSNVLFPIGVRYLLGEGSHHLETGLSLTLVAVVGDLRNQGADFAVNTLLTPSIGYRYATFDGGRLSIGLAYSPRVALGVLGLSWDHYLRISVGVLFS